MRDHADTFDTADIQSAGGNAYDQLPPLPDVGSHQVVPGAMVIVVAVRSLAAAMFGWCRHVVYELAYCFLPVELHTHVVPPAISRVPDFRESSQAPSTLELLFAVQLAQ